MKIACPLPHRMASKMLTASRAFVSKFKYSTASSAEVSPELSPDFVKASV